MPIRTSDPPKAGTRRPVEIWAAIAALVFIALIVAGSVPGVHW